MHESMWISDTNCDEVKSFKWNKDAFAIHERKQKTSGIIFN